MQAPVLGVGQCQSLLGTGDTYITKPALLLQLGNISTAALVRKQAFFHADKIDIGKFKPLGRVQGHHMDTIRPGIGLCFTRFQGGVAKECQQGFHITCLISIDVKFTGRGHQFLQVFYPCQSTFPFFLSIMFNKPAQLDGMIDHLVQFQRAVCHTHLPYQPDELFQCRQFACIQQLMLQYLLR